MSPGYPPLNYREQHTLDNIILSCQDDFIVAHNNNPKNYRNVKIHASYFRNSLNEIQKIDGYFSRRKSSDSFDFFGDRNNLICIYFVTDMQCI